MIGEIRDKLERSMDLTNMDDDDRIDIIDANFREGIELISGLRERGYMLLRRNHASLALVQLIN
jgi:hypothetical protein